MPGTGTNPEDGDKGTEGGEGAAGSGTEGKKPADAGNAPKMVSMTQEDFDRVIAERVARAKPKDYDDLVALRDKANEAAEKEKTDLQKAKDAQAKAEQAAQSATERANGILIRAAIMVEASAANAADAETVAQLLAGTDTITVDDQGQVKGAKTAVKKLLEDKPFLVKAAGQSGASGGQFGGNDQRTLQERIAEAESKGDFKTSRQLKLAQSMIGAQG